MMRRRAISTLCLAASAALAVCAPASSLAHTQQTRATILVIRSADDAPYLAAERAVIERLAAHGRTARAASLADAPRPQSVRGPAVVIAIGSEAAARYHAALPDGVQLVYCMTADPEGAGLHSDQRTFGVAMEPPIAEQFEAIRAATHNVRCVGVLHRGSSEFSRRILAQLERDIPRGWTVEAVDADEFPSVSRAIDALFSRNVDCVWTAADPAVFDASTVRALLLESLRRRIPVYGFSLGFVRAGALIGVSIDPAEHGEQTADFAHAIATAHESGQRPPSPRVRSPKVQLSINLVVADQLGVRPPASLVRSATHVFRAD